MFLQKGYQKISTVRRLCGVYGGTEAESSTWKSSQMAFVISGMTTAERQDMRILDKNSKWRFNINSDVYLGQLDRLYAAIEAK